MPPATPPEPARLEGKVRALLEDRATTALFSAASIWEIAMKARLGRVDLAVRPNGIAVAVRAGATARLADLPLQRRDPFDRLLVTQALSGLARFYTADPLLEPCSGLVMLLR